MLNFRPISEIFAFCQFKEMLFSSGWDLFPGIYSVIKAYKYKSCKDWDNEKIAWTKVNMRYPVFLKF